MTIVSEILHVVGKNPTSFCEDVAIVTPHFACVADGATPRGGAKLDTGETPGYLAARAVCRAIEGLEPRATYRDAHKEIMKSFSNCADLKKMKALIEGKGFVEAPVATMVVVSAARREIWRVGDAQAKFGDIHLTDHKLVDKENGARRAAVTRAALKNGASIEDLLQPGGDPGRDAIKHLLEKQIDYLNISPGSNPYAYGVMDGTEDALQWFEITKIPDDVSTIILASDGYMEIFDTLEETESALKGLMERDPLLIFEYEETKGLIAGNRSFDDRAYVKVSLL